MKTAIFHIKWKAPSLPPSAVPAGGRSRPRSGTVLFRNGLANVNGCFPSPVRVHFQVTGFLSFLYQKQEGAKNQTILLLLAVFISLSCLDISCKVWHPKQCVHELSRCLLAQRGVAVYPPFANLQGEVVTMWS